MRTAVEICVVGVESALAAAEGGADRVELCEYLSVGGITPSAGAIALACRKLEIPVQVLIRPRGGDFVYSAVEFEIMKHDVATAKALGAAAVVLGILETDQTINREQTARLIELAHPLSVTFHKAFDECPDAEEALETLCELGVARVLTSGQRSTAAEGAELLARLTSQARDRLVVMAGGRITEADAKHLIDLGIRELHIGSSACDERGTSAEKVRGFTTLARKPSHP